MRHLDLSEAGDAPIVGAWLGSELVGLLGMNREQRPSVSHRAGLWGFFVSPSHRGAGVGKALLKEMILLASRMPGLQQIRAGVSVTSPQAVSLLENFGFERFGLEPDAKKVGGRFYGQIYLLYRIDRGGVSSPDMKRASGAEQQDDVESDVHQIYDLEGRYDLAWNAGDVHALSSLFTDDAVLINPFGHIVAKRGEIERELETLLTGKAKGSVHRSTVDLVSFVEPGLAIVDGTAVLTGIRGVTTEDAGYVEHKYTEVLVRQSGTWLIAQVRAYVFLLEPQVDLE